MPNKIPKPCAVSRCPNLTKRTYCKQHTREMNGLDRRRRGSAAERGYDARWAKLSREYAKLNPWCEPCLSKDVIVKGVIRDHIVPLSQGGERLDWWNVQNSCRSCHSKKTARESKAVRVE